MSEQQRIPAPPLKHRIVSSGDATYLTVAQVKARYGGVSDMWVWRKLHDRDFPQPIRFGGPNSMRHWRVGDLEQWEAEHAKRGGEAAWDFNPKGK